MTDQFVVVSIYDTWTPKGTPKQVINVFQAVDEKAANKLKRALIRRFKEDGSDRDGKLKVVVRKAWPTDHGELP